MNSKLLLTIGAIAFSAAISGAQAAPVGPAKAISEANAPLVQQTASHCWWSHGIRHCRHYRGHYYRAWRPRYPEAYRTGSRRWWQEMDREDRGGRGRP
jgi:hypothetical protein